TRLSSPCPLSKDGASRGPERHTPGRDSRHRPHRALDSAHTVEGWAAMLRLSGPEWPSQFCTLDRRWHRYWESLLPSSPRLSFLLLIAAEFLSQSSVGTRRISERRKRNRASRWR